MNASIERDYAFCEEVIRKISKSFYRAFSALPRQKALSIFAIYAFCRKADDLADVQRDRRGLEAFQKTFESVSYTHLPFYINRRIRLPDKRHP